MLGLQILFVFALILLNGFFAMSELAVVSARRTRLRAMAEQGHRGARAALALAEQPGRFLSAVQVGITLVGILAGALGGRALAAPLAEYLGRWPWLGHWVEEAALALVVAAITYVSLIFGELLPKQIALGRAEQVACWVAPIMAWVARAMRPLVWLLDASTRLGMRLFGVQARQAAAISDEEIQLMVREAAEAGVVEVAEQEMIAGVMRLADRPVSGIMTPRPDVQWLDLRADPEETRHKLRATSYSRLPVCDGDLDEVLGIVQAKDLLERSLQGRPLDLRASLREAPAVPETMGALKVLDLLKRAPVHMALVVDEYGSVMGLVTTMDVLKVIIGGLREHGVSPEARATRRQDGSWLLDGGLPVDEAAAHLGLPELVSEEGYQTLAGWLLFRLDHLPGVGESIDWRGWRFEVVDMDGYRIDKVLATPLRLSAEAAEGE